MYLQCAPLHFHRSCHFPQLLFLVLSQLLGRVQVARLEEMLFWRGRSGTQWSSDSQDAIEKAQHEELIKARYRKQRSHESVPESRRPQLGDSSQAAGGKRPRAEPVSIEGYGRHVFKGAVAAPYLEMVGLKPNTLDSVAWTTNLSADKVAAAMLHWGIGTFVRPFDLLLILQTTAPQSSATGSSR